MKQEAMYAEVAVNTPMARRLQAGNGDSQVRQAGPLGLTFHYAVPPALADMLRPGHLVWVPFGRQELHGVVLGLPDQLPAGVEKARPVLDLVVPEPVCTPAQLELAAWLSENTLSPMLDCVLLLLPPGLIQKAEPVLDLTPLGRERLRDETDLAQKPGATHRFQSTGEAPVQMGFAGKEFAVGQPDKPYFPQLPDLIPEQHALLALLLERGALPERVVTRLDSTLVRSRVTKPLIEGRLISRRRRVTEAPIAPKTGKQVTLIANQETIDRILPTLGRASKQADVLAWLVAHLPAKPTVTAVCQAVGCSPAPLRSLADRGWIDSGEVHRQVRLLIPVEAVEAIVEEELKRAPAQAAALLAVAQEVSAVVSAADEEVLRDRHGVSLGALRALEQRGFLERTVQEPLVTLLVSPGQVSDCIIELRGGEKYRVVLDTLAGEAEPVWVGWLYAETGTQLSVLRELADAGLISISEREIWRDPLAGKDFVADVPPPLTADQARVWLEIEEVLADKGRSQWRISESANGEAASGERRVARSEGQVARSEGRVVDGAVQFLLHGVTGSGKTEIYLRAIAATLEEKRQAIVLVPEIALTPQTVRRFAARFPGQVGVYHSGLSAGERYDVWRKARSGDLDVVVGTRSALFLPLPRLGLLVLDEEHDPSYKESQRAPRYHARAAAQCLATLTGAVVVLGSATPSLETYHAAQLGHLRLLTLPRRILGHAKAIAQQSARWHLKQTVFRPVDALSSEARYAELPPVQIVDLRQELRAGNRSMFSRALQAALSRVLEARQQAIIFLNRRGTATFVMCRDCGHVLTCEHCDVPLTYHDGRGQRGIIVCHHCGRREVSPKRCPECQSRRIRYLGTGTEKIAELVNTMWPDARVVRWDRDVTGGKGSHEAILSRFVSGEANVLVGTQMIAKGLDLPLVTLVGVISADVGLYLPDFRAAERSFQLLTQVAGRAGRSLLGGQVIVQSYRPEHYAIQAARRHDYLEFYRQELSFRRQVGYPPFRRLAKMVFAHPDQERVQEEARAMARQLTQAMSQQDRGGVELIGPAPCFFGRERGKYRWQIVVRAVDPAGFLRSISIPQGWRIDVDPVSLL